MNKNPFDLAIDTAKIIRRPLLECVVDIFIDAKDEGPSIPSPRPAWPP
jgi:hypothetical protein